MKAINTFYLANLRDDATWYIEFCSIDEIEELEQPERSHNDMFRCSESRSINQNN